MQQDSSSPDLVPETSAALLRLAVLLHWAWHYWQDREEILDRSRVLYALLGSVLGFSAGVRAGIVPDRSTRVRELEQPQQQQQQPGQSPKEVSVKAPSSLLFFPAPIYLHILDDVLLLVNRLLALLLPEATSSNTTSTSNSNSSSNSSSSNSSSGCSKPDMTTHFDTLMKGSVHALLEAYNTLSSSCMTVYADMVPPQQSSKPRASFICCSEAPALREDAAVWFQHAGKMCQVLEAYVRATAHSQAIGSAGATCPALAGVAELGATAVELIDPTEAGLHGPLLQAAIAAGPGSKEQQQLHGLLRSTIKWAGMMGPEQQALAEQLRAAVAVAAANMLQAASRRHGSGSPAALEEAEAESAAGVDGASSTAATGGSSQHQECICEQPTQHGNHGILANKLAATQASTAAATVLLHLPWLGVLGCCCLQWSHQLGRLPTDNPAAAAAAIEPKLPHSAKGVFSIQQRFAAFAAQLWRGSGVATP